MRNDDLYSVSTPPTGEQWFVFWFLVVVVVLLIFHDLFGPKK